MPDVDPIAALADLFPHHAWRMRRLHAGDPTFRAICEDYGDALRALAHWQAAARRAHGRADEYRRLVREIEDEALTALEAAEHG